MKCKEQSINKDHILRFWILLEDTDDEIDHTLDVQQMKNNMKI